MITRLAASTSLAAAVMMVLASQPLGAQAPAEPASAGSTKAGWSPPKTPWGEPDLQGSWPTASLVGTPFERPAELGERRFLTDEEVSARTKQYEDDAERVEKTTEVGGETSDGTGPPAHWGEG